MATVTITFATFTGSTQFDNAGNIPWSNPGNVATSNNVRAAAALDDGSILGAQKTCILKATNGSGAEAMPDGSTINSFTWTVEGNSVSLGDDFATDAMQKLIVGGVVSGNDKKTSIPYGGVDAIQTYGPFTPAQMGLSGITAVQIKATNFGMAMACLNALPDSGCTVNIDKFSTIVVDYTAPVATGRAGKVAAGIGIGIGVLLLFAVGLGFGF